LFHKKSHIQPWLFLCVVCLGLLGDFNSEKTTTNSTARVSQGDVS